MALGPAAYVLWTRLLFLDPGGPGTGFDLRSVRCSPTATPRCSSSIVLHVTCDGVGIDDLKQQRQLGSINPGDPEQLPDILVRGQPPGRSATGSATWSGSLSASGLWSFARPAVGEQVVERLDLGPLLGRKHHGGRGLRGVLVRRRPAPGGSLILLNDDNHITIDGHTEITFGEDVEARYRAYGWHTVAVEDANDPPR